MSADGKAPLSAWRARLAPTEWAAYVAFLDARRDPETGEEHWSAATLRRSEDLAAEWSAAAAATWGRGEVAVEAIVTGEAEARILDPRHAGYLRFDVDRDELWRGDAMFAYGVTILPGAAAGAGHERHADQASRPDPAPTPFDRFEVGAPRPQRVRLGRVAAAIDEAIAALDRSSPGWVPASSWKDRDRLIREWIDKKRPGLRLGASIETSVKRRLQAAGRQ